MPGISRRPHHCRRLHLRLLSCLLSKAFDLTSPYWCCSELQMQRAIALQHQSSSMACQRAMGMDRKCHH